MSAIPTVTTAALTMALTMALTLLQAFSIVPAECIVGRRLGFYYELIATLLLPALSFCVGRRSVATSSE